MLKVFDLEGKPYTSYDVFSQMYHNAKSVRFGRETLHLMMYSLRCITMLKVFDLEGKPYASYDVFSQMYHNAKSVRFGRETFTSYDVFSQMYHNAKSVRFMGFLLILCILTDVSQC